jgi:hypothetical protein
MTTRDDVPELPRVARSEALLISLARGLVGADKQYHLPQLRRRQKLGNGIGPTAMALLQQTLARGVASQLLVRGGWQVRRTIAGRAGFVTTTRGRVWERHQLPPLHFGPASFALLSWMVREDVVMNPAPLARHPSTTLADDLLHYFAVEHLRRVGARIADHPAFRASPLVQLAYPDELAGEPLPEVSFAELIGPGAFVFESLQTDLARRYVEMERHKGTIESLDKMVSLGAAQRSVLERSFAALESARPARRDLASFVVEAGDELLRRGPDRRWWTASLDLQAPLSARQRAFAAAAAFLHALARLGHWVDDAGLVPHFDDDYEAAQLLLANWQFMRRRPTPEFDLGDPRALDHTPRPSGFERAAMLARELDSLHSLGA